MNFRTTLMVGLVVSAIGCGPDAATESMGPLAMEPMPAPMEMAMDRVATVQEEVQTVPTPHLIRTGHLRVEVESLDAALDRVQALAQAVGGYLARSSTMENGNGTRTGELTLRIPATEFDSVVDRLGEVGRVLAESVNVVDVSRDYVDIETRLAVREETVERLRALARSGGGLEDLLSIERELGRALEQLESLKGQLVYYDRRIAESDLEVVLVEPGAVLSDGAFRPLSEAWREAAGVLARSLATILYVGVFLAPWVVLLAVVGWMLRALWIRRRRNAPTG